VAITVAYRAAGVGEELAADACAFAWLALVLRGDVGLDARGLKWVTTVAVHEAWRLGRLARQEVPMGGFRASRGVDIQPITYRGRTVAACTQRRYFLSDEITDRDPTDPLVSFVIGMCLRAPCGHWGSDWAIHGRRRTRFRPWLSHAG
jgi:hypothetical protein